MCPELLMDLPCGYKSDIWSLGCRATSTPPFATSPALVSQSVHSISSVKSPVKSSKTTEEKSGKPSPGKSISGKENMDRVTKLNESGRNLPFDDYTYMQSSKKTPDGSLKGTIKAESVKDTRFSAKISHDTDDSKSVDACYETIISNEDYHDVSDSSSKKESTNTTRSSWLLSNSHPKKSLFMK